MSWTVVVPVKGRAGAKSRLRADGVPAAELAHAFAGDAIAALLAAGEVGAVVVVTDDAAFVESLASPRVRAVGDPGAGLNAAIAHGVETVRGAVAVLLGDLPALRPAELDRALAAAATHPLALVPDAEGTGTTLLTALEPAALVPRFGAGSRAAHEAAGHRVLEFPARSGLRRDVDTLEELAAAVHLGVGPRTAAALRRAAPSGGNATPPEASRV